MSALSPLSRARLPRLADPALVRQRLALVPPRPTTARRAPFVVLVVTMLVGGVVGLLMFNTQMQQASFAATALQARATALTAEQQGLGIELQQLRAPQHLAEAAKQLGMVVPTDPAFVRLPDGKVLGSPLVATSADAMAIRQPAVPKPAALNLPPRIVRVPAETTSGSTSKKSAHSGAASQATGTTQGKKKASVHGSGH